MRRARSGKSCNKKELYNVLTINTVDRLIVTEPIGFRNFYNYYNEGGAIFMLNVKKQLEMEISSLQEKMGSMDPGSEEYLNASKAANQLAEASQKTKKVDVNQMITGGVSISMFILYMIFSENHITDTRAYQWAKGIFKR